MIKVIIVNGYPGSGKTLFESYCHDIMGAFYNSRSSIDKVKAIAVHCGWKDGKSPEDRKFLSDLKDLLTKYNDLPLTDIKMHIKNWRDELAYYGVADHNAILMCDVREPVEIEKLKNELNAITLFIRRDAHEQDISNHADAEVENYKYDYYIDNNGTKEELKNQAQAFINWIFS